MTQRVQAAGSARGQGRKSAEDFFEVLLFHLEGRGTYAINVFKVREAIPCPPITRVPDAHPWVRGMAYLRNNALSIVDLGLVIANQPVKEEGAFVIVAEFNRMLLGFLVSAVDRILYLNWSQVEPPPKVTDRDTFIGSITWQDEELIQIVDLEKLIHDVVGDPDTTVQLQNQSPAEIIEQSGRPAKILLVDDSTVAQHQVMRVLEQLGISCMTASDGQEALDNLKRWADQGSLDERIAMVVTDIEMPRMDGFGLVKAIRKDPRLKHLHVLMHSSLSTVKDSGMVESAGADDYLVKFDPQDLAEKVLHWYASHGR